jgi:hypothetical protein
MTACQETGAYPEKIGAIPEEMKSEAEHEKVPKENAAVKTVRALKKRHRGRLLAEGRRGKLKERTQVNGGCRKKLVAGRRHYISYFNLLYNLIKPL